MSDLSDKQLLDIYQLVDDEIEVNGVPSDEQLMAEINGLNSTLPS